MSNEFYLTFEDLRKWDAGKLDGIEGEVKARCDTLVGLADELMLSAAPDRWSGEAATLARKKLAEINDQVETIVAAAAAARRSIQRAADSVVDLRRLISEADAIAAAHQFEIRGRKVVNKAPLPLLIELDGERLRIADELRDRVEEILDKSKRIDLELVEILANIAAGRIHDGGAVNLAAATAAGEAQSVSYLERYQVTKDPNGTVPFRDETVGEAKLLADQGFKARHVFGIHDFAEASGNANYESNHRDAARHAIGSALLVQEYGEDWANRFTTAHERQPDNNPSDMAMDLHNNEVGRRIAAEHPGATPAELEIYVDEAIRNGELLVLDPEGNLVRSNEIPIVPGEGRRAHLPPIMVSSRLR